MSQKSNKKKAAAPGASPSVDARPTVRSGPAAASAALPLDDFEPRAERAPAPVWIFVLLLVLVYWSMLELDHYAGGFNPLVYGPYQSYKQLADLQPKSGPEMQLARGAAVFSTTCQACHQPTGEGLPGQFPPLAHSEWVQGPPNRVIRIPNNGLNGPISVRGQAWNAQMAAMGGNLSDEDLAAVLSYVRNTWGNSASFITPEQVKNVRAELGNRARDGSAPWTADDLLKVQ